MWEIVWLDSAVDDIVRLRKFIAEKNTKAANKAVQAIKTAVNKLEKLPNIGRMVIDLPDYRDMHIKFGAAGYVMRYRVYQDGVYIVHIRHYRESGFK